jgi:hypothetical protein
MGVAMETAEVHDSGCAVVESSSVRRPLPSRKRRLTSWENDGNASTLGGGWTSDAK